VADWTNFFLGELGASAALAGLLFVSISVNQARILALGRLADRGIDALLLLLLVLIVASLTLIPAQPPRLLGAEILLLTLGVLAALIGLQRGYLAGVPQGSRSRALRTIMLEQGAVGLFVLAGLALAWRGDWAGLYLLVPAILLAFAAAGLHAWVLLIEINR
jgi:hypothetical protein